MRHQPNEIFATTRLSLLIRFGVIFAVLALYLFFIASDASFAASGKDLGDIPRDVLKDVKAWALLIVFCLMIAAVSQQLSPPKPGRIFICVGIWLIVSAIITGPAAFQNLAEDTINKYL